MASHNSKEGKQPTQFVVDGMEYLKEIVMDKNTLVLLMQSMIEVKSDYIEEMIKDLDLTLLSSFLIPDIHGVVSCIKSGTRAWNMGSPLHTSQAKMATTAHLPGRKKMIVLSQLLKQTLAKNSDTLSGAVVSLYRSRLSHI